MSSPRQESQDARFARNRDSESHPEESFSAPAPAPKVVAAPVETKPAQPLRTKRDVDLAPELAALNLLTAEKAKTPLEAAIDNLNSLIEAKDLASSFQRLDLNRAPISDATVVLGNSLIDNKFTAGQLMDAIEAQISTSARTLLISVCKYIKSKGRAACLTSEGAAMTRILETIRAELDQSALATFLQTEDLEFLLPVVDITSEVSALLVRGGTPAAVLALINEKLPSARSAALLKPVISMAILERVFADSKNIDLSHVDSFADVLARCANGDVAIEADVLFCATRVWCKAGADRSNIKAVFQKLYQSKVVSYEGIVAWRDDRNRGKNDKKPQALMAVNSWIADITPVVTEPADEEVLF